MDAPKAQTGWREARARQGEALKEDRRTVSAELTTPALRATPPLRGGEFRYSKISGQENVISTFRPPLAMISSL